MALKLTRRFRGVQVLRDRDADGNEVRLAVMSREGFSPKRGARRFDDEIYEHKGKQMTRKKKSFDLIDGVTFEAQDEDYVLEQHPAIVARA